jgi:hypothetical protein
MSRTLFTGLFAMLIVGLLAVPAEAGIGASFRVWDSALSGDVLVNDEDSGLPETTVDFEDDLDYDTDEVIYEAYLKITFVNMALHFNYFSVDYDGSNVLTRNITFDDQTFTASTQVDSELDLDWGSAIFEFDILPDIPGTTTDLGIMIGLKYVDFGASIEDSLGATNASDSATGGAPVLGLHGRIGFMDYIYVDAFVTGVSADVGDVEATLYDGNLEVGVSYTSFVIGLGYRFLTIDIDFDDGSSKVEFDMGIDGPYLHAGVAF